MSVSAPTAPIVADRAAEAMIAGWAADPTTLAQRIDRHGVRAESRHRLPPGLAQRRQTEKIAGN